MNTYSNAGMSLDLFMSSHRMEVSHAETRADHIAPEPRGWKQRKMFGVEMRAWPRLSMAIDYESQVKTSRGIPRKYLGCFVDDMDPKNVQQAQVMQAMNVMATIKGAPLYFLIVCGGNETGKTYMGTGLVNTLIRLDTAYDERCTHAEWNPMYVSEPDLLSRITGWSNSGKDWFWEYSENVRMLVLDEFGMTQWSPTDKKRMEQLLFKRHGNRLYTVILSNRSQSEITEIVSPTILHRFEESGQLFNLPGEKLSPSLRSSGIDRWWAEPDEDPF